MNNELAKGSDICMEQCKREMAYHIKLSLDKALDSNRHQIT
jgi:hypothetical protein